MNVEVRHLQLIDAITREGSLTRAAERLHVTQSALSHQLRELETRLGTPLFLRVNRRLSLAPAGERLLASARRVLDDLSAAQEDIRRIANDEDGVVRVTTECYTCYHWLAPLLATFRGRFPRVGVDVVPDATRDPIGALLDRRVDLALVCDPRRDPRITTEHLFDDDVVIVVARDHPLASRPFVAPDDLRDETVFLHVTPEESLFAQTLAGAGVRPKRYATAMLTEAIVEMVKAGMGVSAMPRWTITKESGVAVVPFTKKGLRRRWAAATLKSEQLPRAVGELIALLKRAHRRDGFVQISRGRNAR